MRCQRPNFRREAPFQKKGSDLGSRYFLHSLPLYAVEKMPSLLEKIRLQRPGLNLRHPDLREACTAFEEAQ